MANGNNQPLEEFDIARKRAKRQALESGQRSQEALKRQFARAGLTGSGIAIKQQGLARQESEKQLGQAEEAISAQEAVERRRRQEIQQAREFQKSEREAQQQFGREERESAQTFGREEREFGQKFQSGLQERQFRFTSDESQKTRVFQKDLADQDLQFKKDVFQKQSQFRELELAMQRRELEISEVNNFINQILALKEADFNLDPSVSARLKNFGLAG